MTAPYISMPHQDLSELSRGGGETLFDERLAAVHSLLLAWFERHGRELPWRRTRDPYKILVAEMMLQQTGVERVLPKYAAWLERFPTADHLAAASTGEVIRLWAGLGYNSRAIRLQEVARRVVAGHGGAMPTTREGLLALPGIGEYTAGAILCFAYEQDIHFVDTNVRRVLGRLFLGPDRRPDERRVREVAERAVPAGQAWAWHQALMDLGATVCVESKPACLICPLQEPCRSAFQVEPAIRERRATYTVAEKKERWIGSNRYYRGRIVDALRALAPGESMTLPRLATLIETSDPIGTRVRAPEAEASAPKGREPLDETRLRELVEGLARDGLLSLHNGKNGPDITLPE